MLHVTVCISEFFEGSTEQAELERIPTCVGPECFVVG